MILLTGDIHGDVRSPLWVIQRHGLTPDDLLILLGDVGLNYYASAYMGIMKSGRSISLPIMK